MNEIYEQQQGESEQMKICLENIELSEWNRIHPGII